MQFNLGLDTVTLSVRNDTTTRGGRTHTRTRTQWLKQHCCNSHRIRSIISCLPLFQLADAFADVDSGRRPPRPAGGCCGRDEAVLCVLRAKKQLAQAKLAASLTHDSHLSRDNTSPTSNVSSPTSSSSLTTHSDSNPSSPLPNNVLLSPPPSADNHNSVTTLSQAKRTRVEQLLLALLTPHWTRLQVLTLPLLE